MLKSLLLLLPRDEEDEESVNCVARIDEEDKSLKPLTWKLPLYDLSWILSGRMTSNEKMGDEIGKANEFTSALSSTC